MYIDIRYIQISQKRLKKYPENIPNLQEYPKNIPSLKKYYLIWMSQKYPIKKL